MKSLREGEIPDIELIDTEECAILLKKAFNSSRLRSLKEVADKVGMNYNTLKHYFEGHRKPSKEKWVTIWTALSSTMREQDYKGTKRTRRAISDSKFKSKDLEEASRRASLLRCAMLLALDHLRFFRDALESDREVLRCTIPGKDVGYFTSLFGSLYDEEHLRAWKAFSK